ncbi:MAG: hypothetical protein Q7J54_01720 [Candidatus Woesearchaeota archaeon]|nr:hypothetical protein [Candidatus Woesearchaeota archaeon]
MKKRFILGFFALAAVLIVLAGCTTGEAKAKAATCKSGQLVGDIDGDGRISQTDSELTFNIYLGLLKINNICCADVSEDGQVTPGDALLISNIALGNGTNTAEKRCAKPACRDSDGGKNYYKMGIVTYIPRPNVSVSINDGCTNSTLWEFYCSSNSIANVAYKCPYGCANGACLRAKK